MPSFTVIIPLYNKKAYIARAVDSVLRQTFQDYEIIVVNDGSSDGGELILKQKKYEKVKLINQTNQGVALARNNGIAKAQNEFICLLDSDDEWEPVFLEEMARSIKQYPQEHFFSVSHKIIDPGGKVVYPNTGHPRGFLGIVLNFIDYYRHCDGIVNASSVCLRKSYFYTMGQFPPKNGGREDTYLWLRYSLHTNIIFNNIIGSRYNRDAENRSMKRFNTVVLPYHFNYFYPLLKKSKYEKSKEKQLRQYLRHDALLHIADTKRINDDEVAKAQASLLYSHDKITGVLCHLICLLPSNALEIVRNIRNVSRKGQ